MIVKSALSEILNKAGYTIDTCGKVRHFLANRGLVEHKVKTTKSLKQIFDEAYGVEKKKCLKDLD